MSALAFCFLLLSQSEPAKMHPFRGFIPDETTAVAVARPIFRAMLGEEYVKMYEPLYAKKQLGRWVVGGRAAGVKPGEMFFEPYKIAIDPQSARVIAFSYLDSVITKQLRETSPDGIQVKKPAAKSPRSARTDQVSNGNKR